METTKNEQIKKIEWILAGIFCLVYTGILTLQSISNPASTKMIYSDGSIYQYIGHLILKGKMPYVDAFDHKGPLLYLFSAVTCLISHDIGPWILDIVFIFTSLMISYRTVRFFLNEYWSMAIIFFLYCDFSTPYWIGFMPEVYTLPFISLAIYCLTAYYLSQEVKKSQLILAGFSIGACFWLKQTTAFVPGAILGIVLLDLIFHKEYVRFWGYLFHSVCGFMLISVPILLWLWINNALSAMWEDYFEFNFLYVSDSDWEWRFRSFKHLANRSSVWIPLILSLLYCVFWLIRRKEYCYNKAFWHMAVVYGLFHVVNSMAGKPFEHYNIPAYPLGIMIVAILVLYFKTIVIRKRFIWITITVMAGLFVLVVIPNARIMAGAVQFNWNGSKNNKIVSYIQSNTEADEVIAIGSADHAGYYLASGRESATTYPYIQAIFFWTDSRMKDYWGQIEEKKPKVLAWRDNIPLNETYSRSVMEKYEFIENYGGLDVYRLTETKENGKSGKREE